MIPKKLILFGLLVVGGLTYFFKDRDLAMLQSEEVRKAEIKRKKERGEEVPTGLLTQEQQKEREKEELKKERGNRFSVGECVTNRKDSWEFTKILGVGDGVYTIIDCHKYKGCTEQQEFPWSRIEFEYRQGRIIPCSR